MANENIFAAVEALGDQILQYKRYAEDKDAEIEFLKHEVKEYQGIVCGLERERDEAIKRMSLAQQSNFIVCFECKHCKRYALSEFHNVEWKCELTGINFIAGGKIDPAAFTCSCAEWESGDAV